ncbi:MAG: hypothetical protein BZY82_08295 [SAR202 cluster bacterium Io17-Chloro-G3]|nr:MAG: hypothetical protein BZY82_08295 [SAR202 cluster bacterium Io17-Chloro-G3]
MTATLSHILATMPKSWVMKMIPTSVDSCNSLSSLRYWAWIVASSDVVGSSAIRTAGLHEMPIAPTTRWRMPPDNW